MNCHNHVYNTNTITLWILTVKSNVLGKYTTWVIAAIWDSRATIKYVAKSMTARKAIIEGFSRNLLFIPTNSLQQKYCTSWNEHKYILLIPSTKWASRGDCSQFNSCGVSCLWPFTGRNFISPWKFNRRPVGYSTGKWCRKHAELFK